MEAGTKYAIHGLDNLMDPLAPARRLELARQFQIREWIAPAVQILMNTPLMSISIDNRTRIGHNILLLFAEAREALELKRKLLSAVPPNIPEDYPLTVWCESHSRCIKVWDDIWFRTISRALLHPQTPLPFDDAISFITQTPHPGMRSECKQDFLDWLVREDAFRDQRNITERVLNAVYQLCGIHTPTS